MAKHLGKGFALKVNAESVGSINNLGGINVQVDEEEITDITSADGWREFMPTLRDAGTLNIEGYADDADDGQAELEALMESGEVVPCEVIFPTAMNKKWTFNAYVSSYTSAAADGNVLRFSCGLRISGKPSLVAVTPTPSGT